LIFVEFQNIRIITKSSGWHLFRFIPYI